MTTPFIVTLYYLFVFHQYIVENMIDANQVVFAQWLPLPRDGKQLDMSRWFQSMINVIQLDVVYNPQNTYREFPL